MIDAAKANAEIAVFCGRQWEDEKRIPEVCDEHGETLVQVDGGIRRKEANQKLQIDRFKTVALPLYVVLDSENRLLTRHAGILEPAERFLRFLRLQDQG